uniref:TctD-like protein n=1 Tax=Storeatula sp. CCMP1868 TaxID=195070 RepID=A0A222AHK5_9CRYP|nr:TctD-like protein [Storeatula sp. CCMP1868]
MLIDDEERLLDALCRYLNSKGFNVLTAKSTAIAINLLTNFKPDILIVDVMMPEKNGYDFIYWLKKDKDLKNIPFIFLTAKGMTQDRIKGYKLGCQGYITKPFDPEELISVIENIISKNEDFNNIEQIKNEIKSIRLILENVNSNYIQFTPREKDILLEIINGQSNANIAKIKEISIRNVEKYVTRILYKTNCKNRIELIKFSYKFYKQLRANDGNRTRE